MVTRISVDRRVIVVAPTRWPADADIYKSPYGPGIVLSVDDGEKDIGVIASSGVGAGNYPVYVEYYYSPFCGRRVASLTIDFDIDNSVERLRGIQSI